MNIPKRISRTWIFFSIFTFAKVSIYAPRGAVWVIITSAFGKSIGTASLPWAEDKNLSGTDA
jgi:hypothetical protein